MTDCLENLNYCIKEIKNKKNNENNIVNYKDLINTITEIEKLKQTIENQDFIALEMIYSTNYNYKSLQKIAEYYKISKNQTKDELIQDIVLFEKDKENVEKVYKRRKLWKYMKELQNDNYLSKYLLL